MRESIIQTMVNKFLTWLSKKSVTALYKRTHFWVFSWGLDENTDLYLMSEESYHGYHRFGVEEVKDIADTPQTDMDEDIVRSYGFKVESYRQAKAKDEPQTGQPCDGCEYSKPYIEYKCTHHSCKFEDEPETEGSE